MVQMRKLLGVAVLGSFVAFTASAALAEGNADPKFFQFPEQQMVIGTTDAVPGVVAGPDTPQREYVTTHEEQEGKNDFAAAARSGGHGGREESHHGRGGFLQVTTA